MNKFLLSSIILATFSFSLFSMQEQSIDKETEKALITMITEQNKVLDVLEKQVQELTKSCAFLEEEVTRIEALRSKDTSITLPKK